MNLNNFDPLSGFEKFQPASIGMLSELIKSAIIVPTLPVVTMYAPSIVAFKTNYIDGWISITDNELNGINTVFYNIYKADGTYIMSVEKISNLQDVNTGLAGTNMFATAVNVLGFESPASNLIKTSDCFIAGTQVLMANGYGKNIETIVPGDMVQSYNFDTQKWCHAEVEENVSGYTDQLAIVLFEDASSITMASGHPLYTEHGFHSITNKNGYPTLVIGDRVLSVNGYIEIIDITIQDVVPTLVYSLALKTGGGYFLDRPNSVAGTSHSGGSND